MKLQFTLRDVTGRQLSDRFNAAIMEEGVGYERDFNSSAALFVFEGGVIFRTQDGKREVAYRARTGECLWSEGLFPANNKSFSIEDLSKGPSWITALSGFRYTVLNCASDEPAIVEYQGAWRGFLKQDLLPKELFGNTDSAVVLEGSVLKKLGAREISGVNAVTLVETYGLAKKQQLS